MYKILTDPAYAVFGLCLAPPPPCCSRLCPGRAVAGRRSLLPTALPGLCKVLLGLWALLCSSLAASEAAGEDLGRARRRRGGEELGRRSLCASTRLLSLSSEKGSCETCEPYMECNRERELAESSSLRLALADNQGSRESIIPGTSYDHRYYPWYDVERMNTSPAHSAPPLFTV